MVISVLKLTGVFLVTPKCTNKERSHLKKLTTAVSLSSEVNVTQQFSKHVNTVSIAECA